MAKEYKDLVVGLDIGTAKIMVVVAEVMPDGELRIAGLGSAPTHGLKRGVVVNIDATVQSIQQALKEAEMMADCKITRVYTGITTSSPARRARPRTSSSACGAAGSRWISWC